jgi:4-amino-4-deoxy-L-arabinose transferase-like glycosyltransferase
MAACDEFGGYERMRQPSPYILPILLLVVIVKEVDRPPVTVAAICIILALMCALLWKPLRRLLAAVSASSRLRSPVIRWVPWSLAGIVLIGAYASLLLTQPSLRATYTPDEFPQASEVTSSRGFFETERDNGGNRYTWTQDRATVVFDFLVHRPISVTFMLRSAAVAGGPDAPVRVEVNGVEVGQLRPDPKNPAFQPLTIRVVPYNWGGQRTEIKLLPTTFVPGKGDPRTLGTMVQSITIDKSEAWSGMARRLWLVWALPVLALAAAGLALAARRGQRAWANYAAIAVCALGIGVALLIMLLLLRIGFIARTTWLTWILGGTVIATSFGFAMLGLPFGPPEAPSLLHRARIRIAMLPGLTAGIARLRAPAQRPTAPDTRRDILRDLALVFVIALGARLIWVVIVPPWLAPDEPDHYVYTSHLAEQAQIPHPPYLAYPFYPKEQSESVLLTHVADLDSGFSGIPRSILPYLPVSYDYGPARTYAGPIADRLTSSGGRATPYPPLYYLLDAVPYALVKHAPILTRLYAARSGSAVFGALSCVFGYLLAYEVRRQRRWGLTLALCMALLPMYVFDTAVVNNDAAMTCFATLLIWLAARVWTRPALSLRLAFAVGIASGLVLLTKPTALSVVVVAGIVMLRKIAPHASPAGQQLRTFLATGGVYAMGVGALYGPWLAFRLYYFHGIVLGTTPFAPLVRFVMGLSPVAAAASNTGPVPSPTLAAAYSPWTYARYEADKGPAYFYWLLIKTFWGYFGWLSLPLAAWVYVPIVIFYLIGLIGLGIQLIQQPQRRRALWLLCGFVLAHLFFLFQVVNYNVYRATGSDAAFGLQGRYFFPILAPLLLLLISGWDHLCRGRTVALRLAPVAMLGLYLIGLATLLSVYYGVAIG